jgi:enoyl-CoA hydratase/carnithine racemase
VDDQTYLSLKYMEINDFRIIDLSAHPDDAETASVFYELHDVCEQIAWDADARVVLLAIDDRLNQSVGTDFVHAGSGNMPSPVEGIAKLKQPLIGAIRGDATGLALELALACDIRIGTEKAHFGFPGIKRGQIPVNGGTQRLPRLIGCARAMDMILTGRLIDAGEAENFGLLHRVVPSESLMKIAGELAQDMAQKSPLSLSYSKEALYSGRDLTLDQGLKMELDLYLHLFTASDRTEGITAFKEKRRPKFEGS